MQNFIGIGISLKFWDGCNFKYTTIDFCVRKRFQYDFFRWKEIYLFSLFTNIIEIYENDRLTTPPVEFIEFKLHVIPRKYKNEMVFLLRWKWYEMLIQNYPAKLSEDCEYYAYQ